MMASKGSEHEPDILHEAAQWCLRLRDADQEAALGERWLAWIDADPRHLPAFETLNGLDEELAALTPAQRQDLIETFTHVSSDHLSSERGAPNAPPGHGTSAPARSARTTAAHATPRRRRWPLAVAAVLALAFGGALLWRQFGGMDVRHYSSAVAQNRDIRLEDGSSVSLGGASSLVASYAKDRRQLELSSGEAFFQVRHESGRPFVVAAGALSIQDIGTAFNVRRTGQQVSVAVTEGRVRIRAGDSDAAAIELVAGQRAAYDPAGGGLRVERFDPATATAWREHRLDFVDEPLATVIANINRYSARPIHLDDPRLRALSFTGSVKTDAIDGWIDALPRVFPLQVRRTADQVLLAAPQAR